MKILITGAAGFIGSHLAERLSKLNHEVIGVDSLDPYYSRSFKQHTFSFLQSQGIAMHLLDLATEPLEEVLNGVEAIFHLAAQPGNSTKISFETYQKNNLTATYRLLSAIEEHPSKLRAFINISTSSVYGLYATCPESEAPQPISNYGVTKLAAEQLVLSRWRDKGLPACSLRLFSVYGERERPDKLYPILIKSIANKTPFPLFEGSDQHRRSFTYVGDIVEGLVLTLTNWDQAVGQIFNIGSDISITTADGMQIIEELMGSKLIIKQLPKRAGDQLSTQANIEKAKKLLGYQPKTTPQQGLQNAVNWYLNEIHGKVDY